MTNKLFFCAILALCSLSCKDDLEFQKSVQDKNTVQKTGKELTFKGFKVNHRYKTPDVYIDDDKKGKEPLMSVYGGDVSLADFSMKDIAEATEKVFKNYPFPSKAKNYKTDFAMIKKDFPGLDEKDIIKNEKLIEQYYDINLDYEVLQLLKKTKTPITKKAKIKTSRYSSKNTKPLMSVFRTTVDCKNCKVKMTGYEKSYDSFEKCIGLKLMSQGYWITSHKADKVFWSRATYSLVESKEEAYKYFENGQDDKTDAKRHIYWSALLAINYYTISSKLPRLKFAEKIGNANEECGGNYVDAAEMDYHNNAIGRKLFDDNGKYNWWGTFSPPDEDDIREKTINLVDNSSVWIKAAVKYYNDEESDEVREKNIVSDRKYKITQAADKSKPVYLHDPELVDINYLCGNDTKTIYLKGAYAKGWEIDENGYVYTDVMGDNDCNLKGNLVIPKTIDALCSLSCKDDLEFQKSVQDKNTVQKTGKELTFKGFKVNHRYKTPDVYIDDDKKGKEPLMSVYGGDVSLADFSMKDIAEATEKVFKNYPFPSKAKNYKTDFAMIKKDFPGLDEKDIIKNEKLIEQYYDINLDYEVLQLLKKTKTPITKKAKIKTSRYSSKNTKPLMSVFRTTVDCKNCKVKMTGYEKSYDSFEKCIGLKLMSQGYWITSHKADKVFWSRATYSLVESKEEAYKYFENGQDDKTDAKRHIYWSALLAINYYTISSKLPRLKFAEKIGNANEECGGNYVDAAEMDYHNNAIGRKLFDDNGKYNWWGTFSPPDEDDIREKTINLVDNSSVWIKAAVKYYNDEESDEVREKNIVSDRKYKITQAADKSKPVYLHDPELVDINYLCGNDTKTIYLKGAYAKGWEVDTKHLQKVAATKSSITVKSITNKSDLRSSITATLYGVNAKNNNTKKNFYFTINPTNYLSIQKTVSRTPYSTILDVSVSGGNPPYEFYFNGRLVKTSNSPNESIYISSSWAPLQVKAKDDCGKTISVYEMVGIGGMSGGI
uniref:DUF6973 domain-containing protein n=1 Tax=Stylophora pistillata TaxID=50429 RepID=A0A2B4RA10_STYPI